MTADLEKLLAEAEEHDRKATPGPWELERDYSDELDVEESSWPLRIVGVCNFTEEPNDNDEADAAFIAWARNNLPALVKAIRDRQADLEAASRALREVEYACVASARGEPARACDLCCWPAPPHAEDCPLRALARPGVREAAEGGGDGE